MAAPTYEHAAAVLSARLSSPAFAHCERVAATARTLAAEYGVDEELAALAGLLHDWNRERSAPELLVSAADEGLVVTEADEAVPYLLHAETGAAELARALPDVPDAVARAVARHTVGAADMSPLDMVVYLADMIEPSRDYPGVEDLRSDVGRATLEELFARGYARSVEHLVERRRWIHPRTVDVWNRYVAGGAL